MTEESPRLAFGAGPLGNLFEPVSADRAAAAIERAWARGIRHFDTAPHYGRGLSERRVGDALRGRAGYRLSTKAGRVLVPDAAITDDGLRDGFRSPMPFRARYDYSGDGILRSHEASLHRLGLASIDRLLIHDIGAATHGAADADRWTELTDGGGLSALRRLVDEGSVGGIGIGVNEVEACLHLMDLTHLDTVLIAGRYTLLDQQALDRLLPACLAAGTQVLVGGPFNSGILATGVSGPGDPYYDYAPAPAAMIERTRAIERVAARHRVPLPAAALHFPLAHPAVSRIVAGFRSPEQVDQAVDWLDHPIPTDFWADLKAEGLIRADAPVPAEGNRP
jgi:D-threo-aldose 1-dehydrogenase